MTFTTRPVLHGTFGMVAATHWLAGGLRHADARAGGNAFDAAAAAGFVLQVVEPHQNGPGGDLPVVFWSGTSARAGAVRAGPGARAATSERYAELDLDPGRRAAARGRARRVRRVDAARARLRRRCGCADVLEPAIGYAADGFPVVRELAAEVARHAERFRVRVAVVGRGLAARRRAAGGTLYTLPGVAATYRRILDEAVRPDRDAEFDAARDAFYRGFVAERDRRFRLAGACCAATTWRAGAPRTRTRSMLDYRGLTVCKPGPWSQGPVFLQQLALLSGFDLAAWTRPSGCTRRRVRQARVRRSRGVVRRPGVRRRAARRAAVGAATTTRGARWSARRLRSSCARARPTAASRCWHRWRAGGRVERAGRQRHLRGVAVATVSATSSRRRRAAAG